MLLDNEDLMVVEKPSSIPVHPCGNLNYNSLVKILEFEQELPPNSLKPVHRLDTPTSGIVFMAKKDTVAREFSKAMLDNEVSKVYYARVEGDFSKKYAE